MKPLDLTATAKRLANSAGVKRPRQSDLKRAVSTAYYAMFHALCRNCADCLIGTASADRSTPAWRQAYRAIDHGHAKGQCNNKKKLEKFPKDIEDFANLFYELQIERHTADYDPSSSFSKSDVLSLIEATEASIKAFNKVPIKHRRAFAAWTAMKSRSD